MARKPKDPEAAASVDRLDVAALLKAQGLEILAPVRPTYSVIPTGMSSFDNDILGIGGFPTRKISHIWGAKSAGKTTLLYRILAMAQRTFPEKLAVYYDSEYSYNREWAEDAGVDVDKLQVIQGNVAEDVLARIMSYAKTGACSVIVLDSLANLSSKNKSLGKTVPGEFAKMTTGFVRDLCRFAFEYDFAPIFSNHVTEKIGVMYGSNLDYPGGNAFKHNMQLSCSVRRASWIEEGPDKERVGIEVAVTVDKNKLAVQKKTDETNHLKLYFVDGIAKSRVYSVLDDAIRAGSIGVKSGYFRLYDNTGKELQMWHGRTALEEALLNDDELVSRIEHCTSTVGNLPQESAEDSEGAQIPA